MQKLQSELIYVNRNYKC